ncbi:MAG: winged helix-turn-helix transcriptional regulator [Rhodobacteraceae bacterium]|nr:winged helix-turn-helix transcriptional regulator [Paracoccaceae bacterium]
MTDVSAATVTAWVKLMTVSQALLGGIEAALKAAGLPPLTWYDALLEIERAGEGGVRPFELKARLLLPQYGASRLLDRLAGAGLVVRAACDDDGRGQLIRITEAGRRMRRAMWPVYAAQLYATIEGRLDAEDLQRLADLLGRLEGTAEARGAGPSVRPAPPAG